jgi:nitrite reductase/ring-hydroxylating ferredoxin subunit/uncharacterized membrane protein
VQAVQRETVAERIESLDALDAVADPVQQAAGAIVPQGSRLKEALSGTWLGHPLHPPLTDVVVGAWTSALLLDVLGGEDTERAADTLVAAGIAAAVPTALSGLSDWADTRGGPRRVGIVHALGNSTALLLHGLSLFARLRGDRGRGKALSSAGYGIATMSAWLGGHLSFDKGVGVNQTAFDDAPDDWTPVIDAGSVEEGRLVGAQLDGMPVLLVRRGDEIHALDDRCSHRGCPLHEGELDGETITCSCHGSTFRLDGTLVKGPATASQPRLDARVSDGRVEVRAAGS